MKENQTYEIWSHYHVTTTEGEYDRLVINLEVVQKLPADAKRIIALYSLGYAYDLQLDSAFAKSLGGFSTMKEAQRKLLKDWEYARKSLDNDDPKLGGPLALFIMKSRKKYVVCYNTGGIWDREQSADEFEVKGDGSLKHVANYESYIDSENRIVRR